jgi:hypothetical protein
VTAIAAELDMGKGSVSAAEQRGLRRLVVGSRARCAKSADDKTSAASKKRRVAQTLPAKHRVGKKAASPEGPAAVPAVSDQEPLSTAMLRPNKTGSGGFVLVLLGVLVLLLLVMAIQLRGPLLASMWRERSIERGPFKRRYPFERRGAFGPRESFSWRKPLKRR